MPHLPSTRYHRTLPPRAVHTVEEHEALEAEGWADTPAAFESDTPDEAATEDATIAPKAAKPTRKR